MTPRIKRILAAAKAGAQYSDIAERFGVTASRISQICTKHEVRRKRRPKSVAKVTSTVG